MAVFGKQIGNPTASGVGLPVGTRVYRALLTQTGTAAPVATVLENTLGGTPAFAAYADPGVYSLVGTGLFPSGKTAVTIGSPLLIGAANTLNMAQATWSDANTVAIETRILAIADQTATLSDGALTATVLEILVYP